VHARKPAPHLKLVISAHHELVDVVVRRHLHTHILMRHVERTTVVCAYAHHSKAVALCFYSLKMGFLRIARRGGGGRVVKWREEGRRQEGGR